MQEYLMNFVRRKRINSVQKLNFLLFLYQNPGFSGTSEQFAEQLYLGDVTLINRLIEDMFAVGLLEHTDQQFRLPDDQTLKTSLRHLNLAYTDPLIRQKLLGIVRTSVSFG